MNENKVLVNVIVPIIDRKFDILFPVNKKIGNILKLVDVALENLDDYYEKKNTRNLYNKLTGQRYMLDTCVADTDIRNGTILILK